MTTLRHHNEFDHLRRNPDDDQGKISGGHGDVVGDEEELVDDWEEMIEEEEGRYESRIDEAGTAQDSVMAGTGDLDHVERPMYDRSRAKTAAEDNPDLINPQAELRRVDVTEDNTTA